ncbi:hypothetical protein O181_019089 [Austropuccinia psidii MF-1]|uniref:Integrase catalytic domain-containing protein n=1 Tax=Austropuccinia psidii MF-1 TaxID=1389203 RepID=A0A9Q3C8V7_9BASI|nr:hypothetical protein [Austropuccinia psidii MF-1]
MANPTERHEDQYRLWSMIAQANAAIKEDMKLKEDGSNFVSWEDNMAMLLDDFIDHAKYLSTVDGTNVFDEKICRSLLLHLVSDTISSQPAINTLLQNKLKAIVTTYGQTPNFGQIVSALKACARQVTAQQAVKATKTNLSTINFQQLTMDDPMALTKLGKEWDFTPDGFDPEILRTCHLCKQPAYYPILAPTTMKPAIIDTVSNKATPDLYRPRYKPPPVKARFLEMGAEEPDIDILKADLGKMNGFNGCSVCDSGASHSLTGDLHAFCRYQKLTRPIPLSVATKCTGRRSYVEGIGSLVFKGERGNPVVINGVFYSPDASCTLISPAALIRAGATLSSESNDILLCSTSHTPILCARLCKNKMKWEMPPFLTDHPNFLKTNDRDGNKEPQETGTAPITIMKGKITEAPGNVQEAASNTLYLLHSLFGHIGLKRLKKIVQQSFGDTVATDLPRKIANCVHCSVMRSICHNPLTSQGHTIFPMDVVAANLMGPFDSALPSSGRYALTLRDIGSTYGECHVLLRKADATTVLLQVLKKWEMKTTRKIKILCSDNGGKFCNAVIDSWCINQRTTHEKSLPYNHEQNGASERYNRSIADMGRTLLRGSGLPTPFSGFAFMWAAHIQNSRTGNKTPKELLFGEQPFYEQLRIFGEKAFVHVPREKQQKLDEQAIEGRVVMFSPNNKGWLFFIPATNSFTSSVWANFPGLVDGVRTIRQWTIKSPYEKGQEQKKTNISFILNNFTLGEFTHENQVKSQDDLADRLKTMTTIPVPKTYRQAMNSPDSAQWQTAIREELKNMDDMGVYEIAPLPTGQHVLGGGWAEDEFELTFAPTATFTLLRMLLTIVGLRKWYVNSFDFVAAYLNADIKENLWVRPPGFGCKLRNKPGIVGGTASQSNKGIIWLHVDDGIVATEDPVMLMEIRRMLAVDGGFDLNQGCLIQSIIDATWDGTPATKPPLPAKCNLTTLVGTRPDIAYSVNLLARHAARPGLAHWRCLQHLLGYMAHTADTCLTLRPHGHKPSLKVFSDASWGGEFSRSMHGCHAEFMALGLAARHGKWVANLLEDMLGMSYPFRLLCDNTSAIKIAEDCSSNKQTKHSDREFFITNQLLQNGTALLEWVPTGDMYADIMTKPLGLVLHQQFSTRVLHGG